MSRDRFGNEWEIRYDGATWIQSKRWLVYKNGSRYTSFEYEEEAIEYVEAREND